MKDLYAELEQYAPRKPAGYWELYRKKNRARYLAKKALRNGEIEKSPCDGCGAQKVEAHHDDYDQPLKIRWLCKKCHTEVHWKK